MLNLAVLLEDSARAVPDRDAVVHGATRMSYSQLDAAASQVAAGLAARGIGRGDRVAERTGCDVRRLADVMELLIALRLLGAFPAARTS